MFCRMSDSLPRDWTGARGWRRKTPWSGALPVHVVPSTWFTSTGADVGAELECAGQASAASFRVSSSHVDSSMDSSARTGGGRVAGGRLHLAEAGCAHKLLGIPLKEDASLLAVCLFTQSLIPPEWTSGY